MAGQQGQDAKESCESCVQHMCTVRCTCTCVHCGVQYSTVRAPLHGARPPRCVSRPHQRGQHGHVELVDQGVVHGLMRRKQIRRGQQVGSGENLPKDRQAALAASASQPCAAALPLTDCWNRPQPAITPFQHRRRRGCGHDQAHLVESTPVVQRVGVVVQDAHQACRGCGTEGTCAANKGWCNSC